MRSSRSSLTGKTAFLQRQTLFETDDGKGALMYAIKVSLFSYWDEAIYLYLKNPPEPILLLSEMTIKSSGPFFKGGSLKENGLSPPRSISLRCSTEADRTGSNLLVSLKTIKAVRVGLRGIFTLLLLLLSEPSSKARKGRGRRTKFTSPTFISWLWSFQIPALKQRKGSLKASWATLDRHTYCTAHGSIVGSLHFPSGVCVCVTNCLRVVEYVGLWVLG